MSFGQSLTAWGGIYVSTLVINVILTKLFNGVLLSYESCLTISGIIIILFILSPSNEEGK